MLTNGERVEEVSLVKYLDANFHAERSSYEQIRARVGLAIADVAQIKLLWKTNNTSTSTKYKLCNSLTLAILIYDCESWTLNADTYM